MTFSRPDDFDAEKLTVRNREQGSHYPAYSSEPACDPPGSVEFSDRVENSKLVENSEPLENSVPVEAPRVRYVPVNHPPASAPATEVRSQDIIAPPQPEPQPISPVSSTKRRDEVLIPLLDQRIVVDRQRRKIGEVVVRKEIQTEIVEVPIRRERLIVEQVSPVFEQIAVVELGQAQVSDRVNESDRQAVVGDTRTVSGEFASPRAAIDFLSAIASDGDRQRVQVQVVVEDPTQRATYQHWLDRYSTGVAPQ